MNDPENDRQRRHRGSPEYEREMRKRVRSACALGILLGAGVLAEGVNAIRTGTMVIGGAQHGFLPLPGWIVAPIGVFVLVLSVWALVRSITEKN
jgi:hypothetical protein